MLELVDEKDIKEYIIRHHIKYKEIHGEDKTKMISISEHIRLHRKLRREGKCKISPEKLNKISQKAFYRIENPPDWIRKQIKKDIEMKKK